MIRIKTKLQGGTVHTAFFTELAGVYDAWFTWSNPGTVKMVQSLSLQEAAEAHLTMSRILSHCGFDDKNMVENSYSKEWRKLLIEYELLENNKSYK